MNTISKFIMRIRENKKRLFSLLLTALFMFESAAFAGNEDVFTIGMVCSAGATINPYRCTQRDLISFNELVFESVLDFDESFKPVGELALSWQQEAGGVYTFKLRDNVRFHDGTYLSANDVVAAYDYIISLGETCQYYTRCQYIKKMEAVDLYTVKVTGKYESYLTLYAMTFPVAHRNTLSQELACGTGPYWYIGYDLEWLQLDANPYWWKKQPTIKTLFGLRYDDTGKALTALSMGEIDALSTRSQNAALSRLLNDRTGIDYTTLTYELLIPNLKTTIFENVYTRQALMYAIDITTIASNIYMGMVTESEVPIVPGTWLYETQSAVYFESQERALQLLYQGGWGDFNNDGILDQVVDGVLQQFEFTILTYDDDTAGTRTHAAEMIRDQLKPLGISVTVSTSNKSAVQKKMKNDDFDMVLCAVNMSMLPDLTFLVNSQGRLNYSGYADGGMNNLLEDVYLTTDEVQFQFLLSQIQMKIVNELPFMGLFFRKGTIMTTADISGLSAVRETDAFRGIEYVTFMD